MFKDVHRDIKYIFKYTRKKGIQIGLVSLVIFIFLRNYINWIYLIDVITIIGTIIFMIIIHLSKKGKIKAYYRRSYESISDLLEVLSVLIMSAYVRMFAYLGFLIVESNLTTDSEYKLRIIRNAIMPLTNYKSILIGLFIYISLIYYILYYKKEVLIISITKKTIKTSSVNQLVKNNANIKPKNTKTTIANKIIREGIIKDSVVIRQPQAVEEKVLIRRQPRT